ncbi:MAG: HupE/UreJ family protein [Pseudomonadota bacterium]
MKQTYARLLALIPLAAGSVAQAHPGHADGALAGLAHPFLGLDHLLAMVAVGVWAGQLGGRAKWLVPASFVAVMAGGAALGLAGVRLPMVEAGIATSVLLLGLLIALSVKVAPAFGATLVGLFALFHGVAHGSEMPQMSVAWQYGLGFMLATAALHGAGLGLGQRLRRQHGWLRAAGALTALSGAWMMSAL